MKFNEKYNVSPDNEDLFAFASKQEEYEHGANMLMFKFLNEIEKLNDEKKLKRKELAALIGTSASYITQLYKGDKLINLLTLAKLEDVFDIDFIIKIKSRKADWLTVNQSSGADLNNPNKLIDYNKSTFVGNVNEMYVVKGSDAA